MPPTQFIAQALTGRETDHSISDWDAVLRTARLGGVEALLLGSLGENAPETVRNTLSRQTEKTVFNGLRAVKERVQILEAMSNAGVERIVLLKGAALGWLIYPDPLLRAANDLDLLISPSHEAGAAEALVGLGYAEKNLFPDRAASRGTYHERLFWRPLVAKRFNQVVELHTAFAQESRYRIDYEAVIARALPLPQCGPPAYRLSDVDQLLHLAIHLAREQFMSPLKNLLDVHLWVDRSLDWPVIIGRARAWGCATALAQTLRLSERLFGTVLPPNTLAQLGYTGLKRQYLDWWHKPGTERLGRNAVSMRTAQAMTLLPLMDSSSQRIRFLTAYLAQRLADLATRKTP